MQNLTKIKQFLNILSIFKVILIPLTTSAIIGILAYLSISYNNLKKQNQQLKDQLQIITQNYENKINAEKTNTLYLLETINNINLNSEIYKQQLTTCQDSLDYYKELSADLLSQLKYLKRISYNMYSAASRAAAERK